jgi:hypothetical protein
MFSHGSHFAKTGKILNCFYLGIGKNPDVFSLSSMRFLERLPSIKKSPAWEVRRLCDVTGIPPTARRKRIDPRRQYPAGLAAKPTTTVNQGQVKPIRQI